MEIIIKNKKNLLKVRIVNNKLSFKELNII